MSNKIHIHIHRPSKVKDRGGELRVNMAQFRKKWKDYSDNIRYAEAIRQSNGVLYVMDARPYIEWLNEFQIFYTLE